MNCHPCSGHCNKGRQCPANTPAEACTDIGCEEPDFTAAGRFWTLYLSALLVALAAGFAGWLA